MNYSPLASSSSANISSALANRAAPVFTISSISAMALRVCAFGTLSSSGKPAALMRRRLPRDPAPRNMTRLKRMEELRRLLAEWKGWD